MVWYVFELSSMPSMSKWSKTSRKLQDPQMTLYKQDHNKLHKLHYTKILYNKRVINAKIVIITNSLPLNLPSFLSMRY